MGFTNKARGCANFFCDSWIFISERIFCLKTVSKRLFPWKSVWCTKILYYAKSNCARFQRKTHTDFLYSITLNDKISKQVNNLKRNLYKKWYQIYFVSTSPKYTSLLDIFMISPKLYIYSKTSKVFYSVNSQYLDISPETCICILCIDYG